MKCIAWSRLPPITRIEFEYNNPVLVAEEDEYEYSASNPHS